MVDGITITGFDGTTSRKKKKIDSFFGLINRFNPELIICSEMLPVFAAIKFRKQNKTVKIILDITEWFPENVAFKFYGLYRWLKYFQLLLPYIYVLQNVDHLIIGENSKKRRYDFLATSKPKTIIGYYPIIKYFNYKKPNLSKDKIILGYAGVITFDRGILNLLRVCKLIAKKYPKRIFKLILFGKFTDQKEEISFKKGMSTLNNLEIEFENWKDYDHMSSVIEQMDLCFDLRKRNFIYRNSLPIKIFEYMACGKPFIYSDIKPIRDEIDFKNYGYLVNPDDQSEIVSAIENYLNNPELADQHSINARRLIEESKNWESESNKLIDLVKKLLV